MFKYNYSIGDPVFEIIEQKRVNDTELLSYVYIAEFVYSTVKGIKIQLKAVLQPLRY
jgi:hypothetical protein